LNLILLSNLFLLLPDPSHRNLWDDISSMTLFSKLIMIVLLAMSVISWAVMIFRYLKNKRMFRETDKFIVDFRKRFNIEEFYSRSNRFRITPFLNMLVAAYDELKSFLRPKNIDFRTETKIEITEAHLNHIAEAIDRSGAEEIAKLDSGIIFLATTANAAPFLGLLGTVVGIYVAFKDIGARGTATLGVVAPAIAEALIATAAGLAAAIPALIGFNFFVSRNRLMADRIDNFKSELYSAFKKEIQAVEKI